ncbi:hypothetical protein IQ06DRAFT_298053 [Phaeosphaeriaceae sp. SRC1lsM3a]|nr:hypothetical protein IQ06DRAFT_298053 [Stagonospora sp. SRC1lsM3a]
MLCSCLTLFSALLAFSFAASLSISTSSIAFATSSSAKSTFSLASRSSWSGPFGSLYRR